VPVQPGEEDRADWTFGDRLTYNDKLSRAYGDKRFGHHEGLHGALESRFGLIKHKRWFRRRDTALLEVLIVFCIIHTLSIEQRRIHAGTAGARCHRSTRASATCRLAVARRRRNPH
jgi:hypothetical protein